MDTLSGIMAWESGELNDEKTLELFSELIKNGMTWTLQGCYGRMARKLIDAGYLSVAGKILKKVEPEE